MLQRTLEESDKIDKGDIEYLSYDRLPLLISILNNILMLLFRCCRRRSSVALHKMDRLEFLLKLSEGFDTSFVQLNIICYLVFYLLTT